LLRVIEADLLELVGLLVVRGAMILFSLLVSMLLARGLSVEEFGQYSLYLFYSTIVSTFISLGLPSLFLREAKMKNSKNFSVIACSYLLVIAVVVLAVGIGLFFAVGGLYGYIVLAACSMAIIAVFSSIERGVTRSTVRVNVVLLVVPIMNFVGILIWSSSSSLELASAFVCLVVANLIGVVFIIFRVFTFGMQLAKPSLTALFWSASRAFPFWLIAIVLVLSARVDLIIVDLMLGEKALGIFGVATRLADFVVMPLALLSMNVVSKVVYLNEGDKYSEVADYLFGLRMYSSLVALVCCGLTLLFSEWLVEILFGVEYLDAAELLCVLSVGIAVASIGYQDLVAMNALGYQNLVVRYLLAGFLLNVLLSILLSRVVGLAGVSWATAISFVVIRGVCFLRMRRILSEMQVNYIG
jgi:O-antigen/teichoic acid export membrane protein